MTRGIPSKLDNSQPVTIEYNKPVEFHGNMLNNLRSIDQNLENALERQQDRDKTFIGSYQFDN